MKLSISKVSGERIRPVCVDLENAIVTENGVFVAVQGSHLNRTSDIIVHVALSQDDITFLRDVNLEEKT